MIKKIVIGGAAAGLLVAGAASAAKLTAAEQTLANGQIKVSGAVLEDMDVRTFEFGQSKTPTVAYVTLDFDKANVFVEGNLLKADGTKIPGYFGPDGKTAEVAATYKTNDAGVVTLILNAQGGFAYPAGAQVLKDISVADFGGFELTLSDNYS
ncbi:MAG: hypothetical protein MUD05_08205 [Candidatus Nanopelagicales bacterium]|jgi:uncharacterized protein YdeI (BOF family)|nr:hypothetical protein [Candidatus Nanopelagicales bacterium]